MRKTIGGAPVKGPDGAILKDASGKPVVTGGQDFDFAMMPASVATEVEITIASVATEALGKIIGAQGTTEAAQAEAMTAAVGSLAVALGRLGPGKSVELIRTILQYVEVDSPEGRRAANLDVDFTGKSKLKWAVIFEALKVNLGDFFPAGLSLSSVAAAQK